MGMAELKLSDVAVGTPRPITRFDSDLRKWAPADPYKVLVNRVSKTSKTEPNLVLHASKIPEDAAIYHRNYLEYLERCWNDHLGIVVTPDILWFTVLGELIGLVKEGPELYRHVFTTSHEKKDIWVDKHHPSDIPHGPPDMPLNRLIQALREHVPKDVTQFLPEFSTTTTRSRHAMYASFCDLCSPYYNYMVYACGFPAISIQGNADDWCYLGDSWTKLKPLFAAAGQWFDHVASTLMGCYENRNDPRWWRSMFHIERCGSGSQVEIGGWLPELFRHQPRGPRFSENFSTHIAVVDYTEGCPAAPPELQRRKFRMQDGIFYSYQEGDFMVPDFGYTIHERVERPVEEPAKTRPELQVQIEMTPSAEDLKIDLRGWAIETAPDLRTDEDE